MNRHLFAQNNLFEFLGFLEYQSENPTEQLFSLISSILITHVEKLLTFSLDFKPQDKGKQVEMAIEFHAFELFLGKKSLELVPVWDEKSQHQCCSTYKYKNTLRKKFDEGQTKDCVKGIACNRGSLVLCKKFSTHFKKSGANIGVLHQRMRPSLNPPYLTVSQMDYVVVQNKVLIIYFQQH